jgi:hypothetical protein
MLIIPVPGRPKQEHLEFQASLSYMARICLNKPSKCSSVVEHLAFTKPWIGSPELQGEKRIVMKFK